MRGDLGQQPPQYLADKSRSVAAARGNWVGYANTPSCAVCTLGKHTRENVRATVPFHPTRQGAAPNLTRTAGVYPYWS